MFTKVCLISLNINQKIINIPNQGTPMKRFKRLIILFLLLLIMSPYTFSNPIENDSIISLSGQIVNAKNFNPIPLSHTIIKGKRSGKICDSLGIFHLQLNQSDTLQISALGYKTKEWTVPFIFDTSLTPFFQIPLEKIAYMLKEVDVFALGTWNEFKADFVKLKIKEDHVINAQIIKELAPFQTRKPNIVPPQYRPTIEDLHFTDIIRNPAIYLFTKFNRKEKSKRRVAKKIRKEWKIKKLDQFYNAEIVSANTGLKGDALEIFMAYCGPKIEITEITSQYDVLEQIVNNYKAYVSIHEKKQNSGQ